MNDDSDYTQECGMENNYIEQRDGGYWIAGARVSLDSVVYRFWEGLSAETIRDSFPVLTLEQVYGAITYYLAHRAEVDEHLKKSESEWDAFSAEIRSRYPASRRIDERLKTTPARRP